jgi:alpha-galactosidase
LRLLLLLSLSTGGGYGADNQRLPVIFNDYMNCLMGDPTPEKVETLTTPAAEAGAQYFCIDCGWYADDSG